MIRVLRIRDFRLLLAGQLLSNSGDWLLLVAAPLFVFELTASTMATGLTLTAESVPAILLGPVAGVFADRWDRRCLRPGWPPMPVNPTSDQTRASRPFPCFMRSERVEAVEAVEEELFSVERPGPPPRRRPGRRGGGAADVAIARRRGAAATRPGPRTPAPCPAPAPGPSRTRSPARWRCRPRTARSRSRRSCRAGPREGAARPAAAGP